MIRSFLPSSLFCLLLILAGPPLRAVDDQPVELTSVPTGSTGETDSDVTKSQPPKVDPSAIEFWRAIKLLESKKAPDIAKGRAVLQELSDHEYIHAQVLLGNCHLSGSYGFPKDVRKAMNLFRLAAERGNAYAMVSLGSSYATGTGVRKDDAKATEWLIAALAGRADYSRPIPPSDFFNAPDRAGDEVAGQLATDPASAAQATAHFLLGQIETRLNKTVEAQGHYVAAATAGPDGRSGVYQAAVEAAINYAFGRGVPRDPAKAREMLDQSRRLGARMGVSLIHNYVSLKIVDEFAVADLEDEVTAAGAGTQSTVQYQIAQGLADKKSKDYNAAEAARWYELAAENGQSWAMVSLALMYARGELGQPDPVKAFQWFEKAGGGDKPKNVLGVADFGICLQQGFGTPRDPVRAAALFKKNLNGDFVCYLGSIGQCPAKVVSAEEDLQLNEQWAKEKNNAHAQYLLAMRYLTGFGVKAEVGEAGHWLKKAAKAHHAEALCLLGWLDQFQPQDLGIHNQAKAARAAAENYKAAGEAGSVEGLANYANCLNTGFGVKRDEAMAIATYEKCLAIDPRHSRSHANLAGIYNEKLLLALKNDISFGTVEWKEKMLEHYEAAIHLDGSFGAVGLGDLYYEGRLVPQDFAKAYAYYEQAAESPAQKAAAHFRLGYMHEFGQGVPVTYTEAAYHYRLAALEGDVPSLRRLVNFYITGTGVSLDFDRAAFWLNYMVQLKQPDALPMMADVLLKKHDFEHAVRLLNILVDSQNSDISGFAYQRLSLCYQAGQGVEKNPKRSEKYFRKALEKGNGDALAVLARHQMAAGNISEAIANFTWAARTSPVAAYNLGQIYFFGTKIAQDRGKALRFLQQSANENNADAQYFLAGMTLNKNPGAPTLDEAISLAQRAENLGHPEAAALREKLEKRRQAGNEKGEENTGVRAS
jgi:TPR repeat protein